MPRTTKPSNAKTVATVKAALSSPKLQQFLEEHATPRAIADMLEESSDSTDSAYEQAYRDLLKTFQPNDEESVTLYAALKSMDGFEYLLESPIRSAAFVQGFQAAVSLLSTGLR